MRHHRPSLALQRTIRRCSRSLSLRALGAARFPLALVAVLALSPINVVAQKLENVTGLRLEYWRAFHDLIQQEIVVTDSGEIALNTTITPIPHPGEPAPKPKHTVETIVERDLAPLLTFFNDADARQFFAASKPDDRADGSSLSITVAQNSFQFHFILRTRSQTAGLATTPCSGASLSNYLNSHDLPSRRMSFIDVSADPIAPNHGLQ